MSESSFLTRQRCPRMKPMVPQMGLPRSEVQLTATATAVNLCVFQEQDKTDQKGFWSSSAFSGWPDRQFTGGSRIWRARLLC